MIKWEDIKMDLQQTSGDRRMKLPVLEWTHVY